VDPASLEVRAVRRGDTVVATVRLADTEVTFTFVVPGDESRVPFHAIGVHPGAVVSHDLTLGGDYNAPALAEFLAAIEAGPVPRSAAGAGRGAVGHLLRSRKDLLMNDSSTAGSLRFGVIGVGIIGRQHVARLLSDASPATLVALADANPDAARAVAEENGVEAAASVEELLAREDIDVVIIAVPSGLHADVTVEALDAGKHVFLEKPIEVTVEASDRIRDAEQRSGKILSI